MQTCCWVIGEAAACSTAACRHEWCDSVHNCPSIFATMLPLLSYHLETIYPILPHDFPIMFHHLMAHSLQVLPRSTGPWPAGTWPSWKLWGKTCPRRRGRFSHGENWIFHQFSQISALDFWDLDDLWWFMMITIYDDFDQWWLRFMMSYDSWWFMMMYDFPTLNHKFEWHCRILIDQMLWSTIFLRYLGTCSLFCGGSANPHFPN